MTKPRRTALDHWKMLDDLGPGTVLSLWDAPAGYDEDHAYSIHWPNENPLGEEVFYFGRTAQAAIENATNKTKGEPHP
jgi:hypothetical protein